MSLSRPQPLAPNSWLDGLVTTVPGTGRVVLADDAGGRSFDGETAPLFARALNEAIEVSQCPALAYSIWRTTHSIEGTIASADQGRNGLRLELRIAGYTTTATFSTQNAANALMEMLDVWHLAEVQGLPVEVLYTNDAGSGDHEFRIANGSIVRALRRLDLHPEALVH